MSHQNYNNQQSQGNNFYRGSMQQAAPNSSNSMRNPQMHQPMQMNQRYPQQQSQNSANLQNTQSQFHAQPQPQAQMNNNLSRGQFSSGNLQDQPQQYYGGHQMYPQDTRQTLLQQSGQNQIFSASNQSNQMSMMQRERVQMRSNYGNIQNQRSVNNSFGQTSDNSTPVNYPSNFQSFSQSSAHSQQQQQNVTQPQAKQFFSQDNNETSFHSEHSTSQGTSVQTASILPPSYNTNCFEIEKGIIKKINQYIPEFEGDEAALANFENELRFYEQRVNAFEEQTLIQKAEQAILDEQIEQDLLKAQYTLLSEFAFHQNMPLGGQVKELVMAKTIDLTDFNHLAFVFKSIHLDNFRDLKESAELFRQLGVRNVPQSEVVVEKNKANGSNEDKKVQKSDGQQPEQQKNNNDVEKKVTGQKILPETG